uniref:NADH-ubiquinone oxidoreductase chain 4 n=2 Tax=Amphiuma means TaxID=8312 RepID=C9DHD0_AMPME|nr:NADH dehydrogenase subunit 4 [Amphiuma means]
MLKILIPTVALLPTTWLSNYKWVWTHTTFGSLLIALMSLSLLGLPMELNMMTNKYMSLDHVSSPLLVLTCWLMPLMLLASQNHLKYSPPNRQRTYISLLITLQASLVLSFSVTELMMFYIAFETTLVPTLIIITRWGNQTERLNAGTYFLFYTLMGSLPLLVSLMYLSQYTGTLSLINLELTNLNLIPSNSSELLWLGCMVAFMVKMPLYGMHLWLPKAHVEAPIAGSMVLAAVLLKLGGYGIIRITMMFSVSVSMSHPFMIMALWGVLMSGMICTRQTDLKALIAYSSISHMGLVIASTLIQTPWSFTGAMIMMTAHGLISSAMFCLANINYERLHSRSLLLTRGMQTIFTAMSMWWLIVNLSNMALPPTLNLWAELIIMTSLFNWSVLTVLFMGLGMLITAMYTLYMFMMTQRSPLPDYMTNLQPTHTREHCLMALHILPTILLIFKPELVSGGFS